MSKSSEELCRKLIDFTDSAEVLEWLESDKRTLGVMSHADSVLFVEKAYRIGVQRIIAVEIDTYPDDSQNTGRICVEMPDDPEKRNCVFSWAATVAEEQGFDGEKDVGQKLVFLMLD